MNYKEITLIQSLDFPTTVTHFSFTSECLVSVGSYKPVVKIHLLHSKDLKNERNIENEPVKVLPLENDCGKLAILRNDRYIEFHAKYGHYYSLRIPKLGRDIMYNSVNANIYIQSDSDIQMFDLEVGKYTQKIEADDSNINCFHMSHANNLLAIGTDENILYYDMRSNEMVKKLGYGCNALFMHENGIDICHGNRDIMLCDIRSEKYKFKVDNDKEVKSVKCYGKLFYAMDEDKIIVSDGKESVSIDEKLQNCFDVDENVIFMGGENGCIKTYYNTECEKYPAWCTRMNFA